MTAHKGGGGRKDDEKEGKKGAVKRITVSS